MLQKLGQTLHSISFTQRDKISPELLERFQALKDLFHKPAIDRWELEIKADQPPGKITTDRCHFAEIAENAVSSAPLSGRMAQIAGEIENSGMIWSTGETPWNNSALLEDILRAIHIDPTAASKALIDVKGPICFSPSKGWATHEGSSLTADCETQLLAAAVELRLETPGGPDFYEFVKAKYFDVSEDPWKNPVRSDFYSRNLLLAIYVELQLDPEAAWQKYEDLKRTELFDNKHNQWLQKKAAAMYVDNIRNVHDQFLGLLIEIELAQKLNAHNDLDGSTFPMTRDF